MKDHHLENFWLHDDEATKRGSEWFYFLRKGLALNPPEQRTGYVLMSAFDAMTAGKPYRVLTRPNPAEIPVLNWDHARPATIALEALYYTVGKSQALLRAQRSQLAWFKATGQWLPVLRFTPGQAAAFGYDDADQLYTGYTVASRIRQRYADTAARCPDGSAAFNCNGVLLRTTDVGNFHAWDPSPSSITGNGVSFSYLRADTRVTSISKPQGFIVRPLSYPVTQRLALRCAYPFDAHTVNSRDMCDSSRSCASSKVATVEAWTALYKNDAKRTCYFETNPADFQLSNQVRGTVADAKSDYGWNEPMMAAWTKGSGAGLPLEAFIYSTVAHESGPGLQGAQAFQMDFYESTGRHLPILRVQPGAAVEQMFTYMPEDQKTE
ncbi:hypothetical protein [Pseudomonas sp. microsymbiont 2]